MRLICPNCVAQYEVDEGVIPSEGRDVQCANCGHNWFQDALQMLSADAEVTTSTGDPDSDVPAELFNDLEGKLDSGFVSARADVAPNPNDMEPEEARDDFQIETEQEQPQEPEAPSSRLDQDALDILHAEAEYSSGEKPPAASKDKAETLETIPADPVIEDAKDLTGEIDEIADSPEEADQEDQTLPEAPEEDAGSEEDDRAEIPVDTPAPIEETQDTDDLDDLIAAEFGNAELNEPRKPATATPEDDHNPFRRPTNNKPEIIEEPAPADDDLYEENIPQEEEAVTTQEEKLITAQEAAAATALEKEESIGAFIDTIVSEQISAAVDTESKPRRKVSARRFPNIDDAGDDLYGAPEDRGEALKNIFPDVDELSSEIAHDAEKDTDTDVEAPAAKAKSGFVKGFKYAILLYILIGILYFLKPFILEHIPQAEGFLDIITMLVDAISNLITLALDKVRGLIG